MADRRKPQDSSTDEKRVLWLLRKVPLLEGLPPERIAALAAEVELREIPRRQVIYLPGDPGHSVFVINGGRVKCSKVTRDGKELTLAYRGAGELFGELAVLDGAPREQMAEAMFGNGISIVSASYTGASVASGIYTDGDSTADAITPSDTGVILSTGDARDVTNSSGDVNVRHNTSTNNHTAGDSDLSALSGGTTYDAAVFEAEFVPEGSTLTM